jgi:CspA family cold shock protein
VIGRDRIKGIVKFFNAGKGYGFIKSDDDNEVFLHIKSCSFGYIPEEDDVVEYSIMHVPKGIAANNVSLVRRKSEEPILPRNPNRRVVMIGVQR